MNITWHYPEVDWDYNLYFDYRLQCDYEIEATLEPVQMTPEEMECFLTQPIEE